MIEDLRVCRRCGVVFDVEIRKNKDCPVCHSGEHMVIQLKKWPYSESKNDTTIS